MTLPFSVPHGYAEIEKLYGTFAWHDIDGDPGAAIAVDPKWSAGHIITVALPDFIQYKIYCHRLVADSLTEALTEAHNNRPDYIINSAVSFVPRHKRHNVELPLSLHSWGIAVDLNPKRNPMGAITYEPALAGKSREFYDMPQEYIDAFTSRGWMWGGNFKGIPDPQHFQLSTGA